MALEDPEYVRFVRGLFCAMCGAPPPNEAHHTGPKGISQRAHDQDAIPLCASCHHHRHRLSGPFKGWVKQDLKAWERSQVVNTRLYQTEDVF